MEGGLIGANNLFAVAVESEASLGELVAFQQRPEILDTVLLHPLLQGPGNEASLSTMCLFEYS
jgi:hypothetical protein